MSKIVKIRRFGLAMADAALVAISLLLAYNLRYDGYLYESWNQYLIVVGIIVLIRVILFMAFGLYRGILRYASVGEMSAIIGSVVTGSFIIAAINYVVFQLPILNYAPALRRYLPYSDFTPYLNRVPLGVLAMECAFTILAIAAVRFSRRILVYQTVNMSELDGNHRPRRLLIVGAGDLGEAALRQINASVHRSWKPVALVDDDTEKRSYKIHGVPVAGALEDIPTVIAKYDVEDVLIAMREISPDRLRDIISMCEHGNVRFQILPSVQDVMSGRVALNQIRPVEIEDLLGRDPIKLILEDDKNYVRNEVIMITGAGGSIGSELCRQLCTLDIKKIVLYGHGENSIYEISQELSRSGYKDKIISVIGDVRDRDKLSAVAQEFKPTIFFHAAAHKHVPLMEAHPDEAIKNNVTGTRNVVDVAEEVNAKRFILISSDKAVRPTNVMGATKRIAEMIVFSRAETSATQFVSVRFGNVLGSRGSVVPLFKKQIADGGPVTLTHPDVVRYFMTIPEAVSLVIQAGSMGAQRRLYLLDMGQPVRIVDLARNLIRLSGFEPDKEIPIVYTGLRPGEKLKEELLTNGEDINSTEIGKIFTTEPEHMDPQVLAEACARLEELAKDHTRAAAIRDELRKIVPDYHKEKL